MSPRRPPKRLVEASERLAELDPVMQAMLERIGPADLRRGRPRTSASATAMPVSTASRTCRQPASSSSSATASGPTAPSRRGTAGARPTRSRPARSDDLELARDAPLILRAHLTCLLGEWRQTDALAPDVDMLGVLDRPRHDGGAVFTPNELRAVHLVLPVRHPHAVEQEGVVRRGRVAGRDRDLQHLEA